MMQLVIVLGLGWDVGSCPMDTEQCWPGLEVGMRKGNQVRLIAGMLGRAAGASSDKRGFGKTLILELVWRRRSLW